ncbi:MAG: hypothetical protein WCG25_06355 [bacterium]
MAEKAFHELHLLDAILYLTICIIKFPKSLLYSINISAKSFADSQF